MSFSLPPIVKLAERLLLEIEQAVRRFPRYHKYTCGKDLRERMMQVCTLAHRAWRDREQQAAWLEKLKWSVDDLKISMQLAQRVKAFASFNQFEMLSRLQADLGRQVGGWHKQKHPKGQNADAISASSQRAQILSARAASRYEANP